MTIGHDQAQDLLEGYALWSLREDERDEVERHLADCAQCRADARALENIVASLPDTIVERSPSPGLRGRVLALASTEAPPRRRLLLPLRPAWAMSFVFLALALVSGAAAFRLQVELVQVQSERDELAAIALNISEGARWWYMSGVDSFTGSEGALIDPRDASGAYVLFHGLKPVGADDRYAVWLIRPDGAWVRAANFRPTSETVQRVAVPLSVSQFVQCTVTVETRDSGAPQGAVAMRSRVFGQ